MNELLLVVTIAGERVALPAAAVESVVELDTLIPCRVPHLMWRACRRYAAAS